MIINFNMVGLDAYGGTRVIFELTNELAARGHEIIITTPGTLKDADWFDNKINAKFNFVLVPYKLQEFYKIFHKDVVEECLKPMIPDCDINIATHYTTARITLNSKKGIPVYLVQHYEALFAQTDNEFCKAILSIKLPLYKICVSKWLQDIIKYTTMQESTWIGNGINLDTFYPIKRSKPTHMQTILFFSRDQEWKGTKEAKETINILKLKRKDLNIIEIKKDTRLLDRTLADLYRKADVFLFTSHYEGFGLPPLEAMACGTPVVTTDCIGVNEYAINNYNSLVVARYPQLLADAIDTVFNNPDLAQKLRNNGLRTANELLFSKVVNRFEDELIRLKSLK